MNSLLLLETNDLYSQFEKKKIGHIFGTGSLSYPVIKQFINFIAPLLGQTKKEII